MIIFAASASTIPLWIVLGYLVLLLGLGIFSSKFFRGTSKDYFVASRSIGSFMLLMSVFGTTMTGFALVGSSGKAFNTGVATYGAVAAWSGIIHSAIFFIIGLRLWAIGKRHGYVTQVQFFRDRFNSQTLGTVLFVLLVLLIIPYLLIGIISAGNFVEGTTKGMFN
ncbi:MAG: sodium:solute symporter family protein, partial [Verrucomicrobiales bacterium]|nr:sodium:solute symporter family protein [Verrucomicrobiales bacterium]